LLVAAVGRSGSGKTFTLEYLIAQLSGQGYRIGSIKHVHHKGFTMDKEGTNTWRYAKAGAKVIVAISPEEVAIIKKTELALNELDHMTSLIENEKLDIIFIEGFHSLVAKRNDVAKIITAKNQEGLEETLEGTVDPILAITGVVSAVVSKRSFRKIPIIRIPEDGQSLIQLITEHLGQVSNKSQKQAN
jgi:molybdopterin-guanine dinucleotide biosynthesis protein MobB